MRFIIGTLLLIAVVTYSVVAQDQSPAKQTTDIDPSAWKEFRSDEGNFTVSFPGTPQTGVDTFGTSSGPVKVHFFVLSVDTVVYYVSFVDNPVYPRTSEERKKALDGERERAIRKRRLISEKEITFDGIAGKELLLENSGLISRGRFFYAHNRLFHLILSAPAGVAFRDGKASANAADRTEWFEKSSAKFFDSFKFTKSISGSRGTGDPPPPQVPPPSAKIEDGTVTVGKEFKSNEGGYRVIFPGDPILDETTVDSPIGSLKMRNAAHIRTWGAFIVSYMDLPVGPETPAENKAALDGSRDELIAGGHRLISESDVTIAGVAGREWLMEKGNVVVRARAFYSKQRFYQLIFSSSVAQSFRNGRSSPNPTDRTELFETSSVQFFNSFKLTK